MRRDSDLPSLPHTDSQETLVHACDHISHPNVGVVGAVSLVAVGRQGYSVLSSFIRVKNLLIVLITDSALSFSPCVKGDSVQEGAVVVVTDVISNNSLS